jgi:hypothetical protein
MSDVNPVKPPRREDGSPSNWDRDPDLLIRRQVRARSRQWCVRRVDDFLEGLKPASLSSPTADQSTDCQGRTSSRSDLAEPQVSRIVDALRWLLVDLADVPVGKGFDWNRC